MTFGAAAEGFKGLSGGKKHMWLRQHRRLVLDYYNEFGEDATLQRFQMASGTLYALVHSESWDNRPNLPRKDERALLKADIALSAVGSIRKQLEDNPTGQTTVMVCQLPTGEVLTLLENILVRGHNEVKNVL